MFEVTTASVFPVQLDLYNGRMTWRLEVEIFLSGGPGIIYSDLKTPSRTTLLPCPDGPSYLEFCPSSGSGSSSSYDLGGGSGSSGSFPNEPFGHYSQTYHFEPVTTTSDGDTYVWTFSNSLQSDTIVTAEACPSSLSSSGSGSSYGSSYGSSVSSSYSSSVSSSYGSSVSGSSLSSSSGGGGSGSSYSSYSSHSSSHSSSSSYSSYSSSSSSSSYGSCDCTSWVCPYGDTAPDLHVTVGTFAIVKYLDCVSGDIPDGALCTGSGAVTMPYQGGCDWLGFTGTGNCSFHVNVYFVGASFPATVPPCYWECDVTITVGSTTTTLMYIKSVNCLSPCGTYTYIGQDVGGFHGSCIDGTTGDIGEYRATVYPGTLSVTGC